MKVLLLLSCLILLSSCTTHPSLPIHPLATAPQISSTYRPEPIKLAFLPYWQLSQFSSDYLQNLTDLAYFAIAPTNSGTLVRHESSAELNISSKDFIYLTDSLKKTNVRFHLTLALFDQSTLITLNADPSLINQLVDQIVLLCQKTNCQGIHLDVEPQPALTPTTSFALLPLFTHLLNELHFKAPHLTITIDVIPYAFKAYHPDLLDLFQTKADYVLIMAYDYHHRNSPFAGPISPLFHSEPHAPSVMQTLKRATNTFPLSQIILGIPLYGYQWTTASHDPFSATLKPPASTILISQVTPHMRSQSQMIWPSLTPAYIIDSNTGPLVTHYENLSSIEYKLDIISQAQLAGFGAWALGYTTSTDPIWTKLTSFK